MAGGYRNQNIIVGAAAVFTSTVSSLETGWNSVSLPAAVSGTPFATTLQANAGWRNVGYTSDGVEVTYSPDYGEVEVDQLLDTAKMFKQKMTVTVKTSLTEATLENLVVVWAQSPASYRHPGASATAPDATGVERDATKEFDNTTSVPTDEGVVGLEAGALGIEPVERQLVFVGGSPRTAGNLKRERVYHLRRSLSVEASTHSLKRNEATMLPVSFRVLPSEVSGAEYGTVRDRLIGTA
jgi:hypothetical protein